MTVEGHHGPEVGQCPELGPWLRKWCMLETGAVDPSTESEVTPFVAHYESECEKTRHLFPFLLLLRWFEFQFHLCVHRLRLFRGFRLRGSPSRRP